GAQSLGYDASGRVSTSEYTFDGMPGTHKVQYEYDYMGREVKQTHSDGVQIEKTLTLNGWVKSITGVLSEVKHNPRGLPEKISFSNGVVTELGYLGGPGRVNTQKTTGLHGEVYENLTFDFDLMGLLLSSSDTAPA